MGEQKKAFVMRKNLEFSNTQSQDPNKPVYILGQRKDFLIEVFGEGLCVNVCCYMECK